MKRFVVVLVLSAVAIASAAVASADSAYRIRLYACSVEVAGANVVPANTPLYRDLGWTSGTRGLVESAINNFDITITETRNGVTTVHHAVWGPIVQDDFLFPGSWTSNWRIDIAPLAVGESTTLTQLSSFSHPQVDLGLPTSNSSPDTGLLYFGRVPAGTGAFDPNGYTCTITGA